MHHKLVGNPRTSLCTSLKYTQDSHPRRFIRHSRQSQYKMGHQGLRHRVVSPGCGLSTTKYSPARKASRIGLSARQQQRRMGIRFVHAYAANNNDAANIEAVCLGEGLFDMLANTFDVPREEVESWTPYAGGAPCNVSTALAKLGVKSSFASAVGKDDMGNNLMNILKDCGVDLSAVQRTNEPTRDVYVTRKSNGEREFSGFGLPADSYCDCFLTPDKLPEDEIKVIYTVNNFRMGVLGAPSEGAQILVTGTLGLAYPVTSTAMKKAVQTALAGNTLVLVDVNWRPVFFSDPGEPARALIEEYVQLADIVKLTDEECEWLFGMDPATVIKSPCQVKERLPNARGVLVTGGEKGAGYCFESKGGNLTGYIPVFDVDVVDTTGAGDAFTAGFVYQLLQAGGLDALTKDESMLHRAVMFASATGGLTTTKPGAIEGQPALESVVKLAATQVA